jgi:hypothetical protein
LKVHSIESSDPISGRNTKYTMFHQDNKHYEDVVSHQYWDNHKPYVIKRSEDEADSDTIYRGLQNSHSRRVSFHESPEYQEAIKAYRERVGPSPDRPHEHDKMVHRTCHLWPFPHMVEDDPKEIGETYWQSHVPYIISHANSTDTHDPRDGSKNFADGEYDEVRKVRMELEQKANSGITGAIKSFLSPMGKNSNSSGTPANEVKQSASPAPSAASSVSNVPFAPVSVAPALTSAVKKVSVVEEALPTPPASQASSASRSVPLSASMPVPPPAVVPPAKTTSAPAAGAAVEAPSTTAAAPSQPIDVISGVNVVQDHLMSWASAVTSGINAVSASSHDSSASASAGAATVSVNPTAEDSKGMTPEQLDIFRYNVALQSRKNRVDELKELISLEDKPDEKKKLQAKLKAYLETPPPTFANPAIYNL